VDVEGRGENKVMQPGNPAANAAANAPANPTTNAPPNAQANAAGYAANNAGNAANIQGDPAPNPRRNAVLEVFKFSPSDGCPATATCLASTHAL
jgi:hypothetical protein